MQTKFSMINCFTALAKIIFAEIIFLNLSKTLINLLVELLTPTLVTIKLIV